MRYAVRRFLLLIGIASATFGVSSAYGQQPADKFNYSRSTDFVYDANGQLQSQTMEKDIPSLCSVTTFAYDKYGNRTETVSANCPGAAGNALFTQRKSTQAYDAQPVSSCAAQPPLSGPIALQPGAFPTLGRNGLGHEEISTFDARFGALKSATGPNCLTTTWEVDDFGRTVRERRADGTSTVIAYCYIAGTLGVDTSSNSPNCPSPASAEIPSAAVSFVYTEPRSTRDVKNGVFFRVYSDAAGKVLRKVTEAFDADSQAGGKVRLIVQDTDYNLQGSPVIVTQPYFLDSKASVAANSVNSYGMTMTTYDAIGRPDVIYVSDPNGSRPGIAFGARGPKAASVTQFTYNGLSTTNVNDKSQSRTEERNIDNQIIRVTDAAGAQIAYQYDAFGNLIKTKDALQNLVSIDFDIRGRKTALVDPDVGTTRYDYNALGELVWQESPNQRAKGQSTAFAIDALGRVTTRTEPEFTSTWSYDRYADGSVCSYGIGKLCESATTNGVSERSYYDAVGRPYQSRRRMTSGPTFTTTASFDLDNARVSSLTYPSGLRIAYGYTSRLGMLETVSNGATTYWRAASMNAWGRVERQSAGNNVETNAQFDPDTGRTTDLAAGANGAVFHHGYTYDSLSNLLTRSDPNGAGNAHAVTERYVYDNTNRLEQYSIDGPDMPYPMTRTVDLRYNALGSLTYKTDVGTYAYPAAGSKRPHAVTSISGPASNVYQYDDNGNMTSASAGKYRRIAYTSFDLPDAQQGIEGADGTRYTWQYDAAHARVKEVRVNAQGTRTTWNVHPDNMGSLGFEQEVGPNGVVSNRHYVIGGSGTVGMITTNGAITNPENPQPTDPSAAVAKVEYWHADNLGSISAVTDANGAVTQRMAYDPFGKRRKTDGGYDSTGSIVIDNAQGTDRGFTGHEQMDDIGIIHMNGRIYDANIGRVMQGDPLIQAPDNLQNFDRYSYVLNNPLNLVDPSGYSFRSVLSNFWKWFTKQLGNNNARVQYNSNPSYNAPSSSFGPSNGFSPSCPYGQNGTYSGCSAGTPGAGGSNNGSISVVSQPNSNTPPRPSAPSAPVATPPAAPSSAGTRSEGAVVTARHPDRFAKSPIGYDIPYHLDLLGEHFSSKKAETGNFFYGNLAQWSFGLADNFETAVNIAMSLRGRAPLEAESTMYGICFVAGTLIQIPSGFKNIEDLQAGDIVYAVGPETHNLTQKPVVRVFHNLNQPILRVSISNGAGKQEVFGATPEHPFWVEGKGWTPARVLQAGDRLFSASPEVWKVILVADNKERADTYNFEVQELHNYLIGEPGILVHNQSKFNYSSKAADAFSKNGETMLGANGVQTASKTVWKGEGKARIDVENPNPGQRPGQVHYQDNAGNKYLYDPVNKTFPGAPNAVNRMLNDKGFANGIQKALKQYLGE